jgi:Rod binding domain-containing protein
MLVAEIGKQIARSGGLGLAEPIYQQMLRMQEGRR